ncbi:MAG TPA: hypothetical protein VFZ93_11155 [Albitalea sp.]
MRTSFLASRLPLLGALAASLALAAACATANPSPATAAADSPRALIGDAACDTDAQCATIGLGAKACGGPASYVAWSTLRTDAERLRAAAKREADAQREAQAARGMVSDCAVETDPGAYCDRSQPKAGSPAGVCRLRPGASGRLPAIR